MKRDEFIKRTAQACLACGGMTFLYGQENRSQADLDKERKAREFEKRFKEAYVLTLMEALERRVDEKTRVELMEECGRACARRSGILGLAEKHKGDVKRFVAAMAERLGEENAFVEGDTVHWGYPRCFCELVAEGPDRLPDAYCHCSVGWVLEVFETVAAKPVKVELVQSVKRGAASCRFLVSPTSRD